MAIKVNPNLLNDIRGYGAFDISACFNCGNCTAVCPLAEEGGSFPRRMIRLGQIGAKDQIVTAKEPWLCYYCAECSETCPRQAEPGEYMAALRRYQIATLDPTGLGKLMFRHSWFAILFSLVSGIFLGALLMRERATEYTSWLFRNTVAYETVHDIGIGVAVLLTILLMQSLVVLVRRSGLLALVKKGDLGKARLEILRELITMKRHSKCHEAAERKRPWHLDPRFVHLGIMWGFLMLAGATGLDFLVIYLLPKLFPALGPITLFLPARILGTIGGVVMLWGVSTAIYKRLSRSERASSQTKFADVWLLGYLWILAVTGFWLEIAVTLRTEHLVNDWVLVVHAAMAMQLVLFVGMTKLGHAFYRPFMLMKHLLEKEGAPQ
jgi:ferredoxin